MSAKKLPITNFLYCGLLLLGSSMLLAACGNSTRTTSTGTCPHPISLSQLDVGLLPTESATNVEEVTKPFSDALSKQICKPVHLFVGTNYVSIITAMTNKQADVAFFGPLSYVLAADKGNAEVILRGLAQTTHVDHYYSYIITTPQTGIKTLKDLRGRSFSFTDPASTSGNLMPRYMLKQSGIDPDKDLQTTYVGSHDLSLSAVLSGKVESGAIASGVFESLLAKGKFKESDVVIVAKSSPIPQGPVAVRKELSQSDKGSLQAALLAIKDKAALDAISTGGFIKDVDSTYNPIRDMVKSLNLGLSDAG